MKHQDEWTDYVVDKSATLGVQVEPEEAAFLLEHLRWLLEIGESMNLTAIKDFATGVRLHILDSLSAAPEIIASSEGELIDIGTGGGYPGLPLAVVAHRRTTLLDSSKKKARALKEFIADRQGIDVLAARAEEHALERREGYATAVARAVAPLPSLVELAAPLLADGGRLVCLKGKPDESELRGGDAAAEIVGLRREGAREFRLPEGDEVRTIVWYRKAGVAAVTLPRRIGKAQSRPLA